MQLFLISLSFELYHYVDDVDYHRKNTVESGFQSLILDILLIRLKIHFLNNGVSDFNQV